uniref:Transmembrane protein 230 n=1 Tax=Peronospora matthiolae TaxID=2874970 RepID=A0AAV1UNI3_9STRA
MVKNVYQRVAKVSDQEVVDAATIDASSARNHAGRAAFVDRNYCRKVFPIRTGLAAASLLIVGWILIIISMFIGLDEENRGLSCFILGLIAFIPGSYASFQLYGAWKGWKGYDYNQIPSYDD